MATLSAYLKTWSQKLSHAKTLTAAFYLHNQEVKHELTVYANSKLLPFCPDPTNFKIKLDKSLTLWHHLKTLRKKLATCIMPLKQLMGSRWALVLKHCIQLPNPWFTLWLSTPHQFGVAAHTPVSSTVF